MLNRGAPVFTRVGVINMDEDYLFEFSAHGDDEGKLRLAAGIALDGKGNVYVTDEYHHRVSVFSDEDGAFIRAWGEQGDEPGQLDGPSGIAIDADGDFYIADQNNHRVQKFDADGRYILSWGGFGSGDGQMNMPWGICAAPDGNIYVADWRNDRIQRFAPDGEFIAAYGETGSADGKLSRPAGVAVDPDGNIYIADWGNERVQTLAPDGSHIQTLRGEATLSKWAKDFFAANPDETETRAISDLTPALPPHINTPHLISSQTEPYFWGPASVNLDPEGNLFVTESSRHRIQVYRPA